MKKYGFLFLKSYEKVFFEVSFLNGKSNEESICFVKIYANEKHKKQISFLG